MAKGGFFFKNFSLINLNKNSKSKYINTVAAQIIAFNPLETIMPENSVKHRNITADIDKNSVTGQSRRLS